MTKNKREVDAVEEKCKIFSKKTIRWATLIKYNVINVANNNASIVM